MNKNNAFARFFSLLASLPGADKEDLIWNFSGMRTTSLREFWTLNRQGFIDMLGELQAEVDKVADSRMLRIRRLRSSVLKRLQQMGIDTTCWAMVNRYLEQPRIAGKRLYDLDENSLQRLIRKLESIRYKEMERSEKERSIAQMN